MNLKSKNEEFLLENRKIKIKLFLDNQRLRFLQCTNSFQNAPTPTNSITFFSQKRLQLISESQNEDFLSLESSLENLSAISSTVENEKLKYLYQILESGLADQADKIFELAFTKKIVDVIIPTVIFLTNLSFGDGDSLDYLLKFAFSKKLQVLLEINSSRLQIALLNFMANVVGETGCFVWDFNSQNIWHKIFGIIEQKNPQYLKIAEVAIFYFSNCLAKCGKQIYSNELEAIINITINYFGVCDESYSLDECLYVFVFGCETCEFAKRVFFQLADRFFLEKLLKNRSIKKDANWEVYSRILAHLTNSNEKTIEVMMDNKADLQFRKLLSDKNRTVKINAISAIYNICLSSQKYVCNFMKIPVFDFLFRNVRGDDLLLKRVSILMIDIFVKNGDQDNFEILFNDYDLVNTILDVLRYDYSEIVMLGFLVIESVFRKIESVFGMNGIKILQSTFLRENVVELFEKMNKFENEQQEIEKHRIFDLYFSKMF